MRENFELMLRSQRDVVESQGKEDALSQESDRLLREADELWFSQQKKVRKELNLREPSTEQVKRIVEKTWSLEHFQQSLALQKRKQELMIRLKE